jgi:acetyl esterase/lipase
LMLMGCMGDSSLYGLVVHRYNFDCVEFPQYETSTTIIDIALRITQETLDNVFHDQILCLNVELIASELKKLKQSITRRENERQKITDISIKENTIQNFYTEFRGILLITIHALAEFDKDSRKRNIPQNHKQKLEILHVILEMCNLLSAEREINGHKSNYLFPFSDSLNITEFERVTRMDTSVFFKHLGTHYYPRLRLFFRLIVATTASQCKSIEMSGTHSNNNLFKHFCFGLCQTYYLINSKASAEKCLQFFKNVTAHQGRSMWNLLDEGIIKPFHTMVLRPIPMSHIFNIPSWKSAEQELIVYARVNSPLSGDEIQESTDIDEVKLEIAMEGISTVRELDKFHQSLKQNDHYINHLQPHIRLRLISPYQLPHDLDVSVDFPIIHNGLCLGGCSSCSHGESDGDLIFHIHGGGFVAMSSSGHESYLRVWAKECGIPIISIDYSTAPESMYPVAVEECFTAYQWIVSNAPRILGVPLRKIIIAGDSAGGNLTLTTTLKCIKEGFRIPDALCVAYPAAYLAFSPSPARLISLIDPLVNFSFLQMCIGSYLDETVDSRKDPFVSPAVAPNEYLAMFPPTYMNVGSLDPLFDDCVYIAKRIDANNGGKLKLEVYDGLGHGYLNLVAAVPEAMAAAKRISAWIYQIVQEYD